MLAARATRCALQTTAQTQTAAPSEYWDAHTQAGCSAPYSAAAAPALLAAASLRPVGCLSNRSACAQLLGCLLGRLLIWTLTFLIAKGAFERSILSSFV
jgi:hypothetical protein